jgi:hypothetical protein
MGLVVVCPAMVPGFKPACIAVGLENTPGTSSG